MATQESGGSGKLPLILAGASVAVSTTVAALAVWWATKNAPAKPRKADLFKDVEKTVTEKVYEEVRIVLKSSGI